MIALVIALVGSIVAYRLRPRRVEVVLGAARAAVIRPFHAVDGTLGDAAQTISKRCKDALQIKDDERPGPLDYAWFFFVGVCGIVWTTIVVGGFVLELKSLEAAGGTTLTSVLRALVFTVAPTIGSFLILAGVKGAPPREDPVRGLTGWRRGWDPVRRVGLWLWRCLGRGLVLIGLGLIAVSMWAHITGGRQRAIEDYQKQRHNLLAIQFEVTDDDIKLPVICNPGKKPSYPGREFGVREPRLENEAATQCARLLDSYHFAQQMNTLIAVLLVTIEAVLGPIAFKAFSFLLLALGWGLSGIFRLLAMLARGVQHLVRSTERVSVAFLRLVTNRTPADDPAPDDEPKIGVDDDLHDGDRSTHPGPDRPDAAGRSEEGDGEATSPPGSFVLDDGLVVRVEKMDHRTGTQSTLHLVRVSDKRFLLLKEPAKPEGWSEAEWEAHLVDAVPREHNALEIMQRTGGAVVAGYIEKRNIVALNYYELGSLVEFLGLELGGTVKYPLTLGELLMLLRAVVQFHQGLWERDYVRIDGHAGNYVVCGPRGTKLRTNTYELGGREEQGTIRGIDHGYTTLLTERLEFPPGTPSVLRPPEVQPGTPVRPTFAWDVNQIGSLGRTLLTIGSFDRLDPKAFAGTPFEGLATVLAGWMAADPIDRLAGPLGDAWAARARKAREKGEDPVATVAPGALARGMRDQLNTLYSDARESRSDATKIMEVGEPNNTPRDVGRITGAYPRVAGEDA